MNRHKKSIDIFNKSNIEFNRKYGFRLIITPYRTGRIKNIRGRERLKFTVHFWEYYIDFLAFPDRHHDRLSKHYRRLYRQ